MMNRSTNILRDLIFTVVGAGVLFLSFTFFQDELDFLRTANHATGTVIENVQHSSSKGGYTYSPLIEFYLQNQKFTFQSSTGSNPPQFSAGQRVQILYQPNDPENAQVDTSTDLWLGPLVSVLLGIIFFVLGLGSLIQTALRNRLILKLQQVGRRVIAKVLRVESVKTSKYGYGYKVVVQYEEDGKVYLFSSDIIAFDPTDFLPQEMAVWVNPDNYKKNYVDIGFLKEKLAN